VVKILVLEIFCPYQALVLPLRPKLGGENPCVLILESQVFQSNP
jgi:hypothetical protein